MGVAVIDFDVEARKVTVVDAFTVSTKKLASKSARITDDDTHRMNTLWLAINQAVVDHRPDCIGVETYTVFKAGQGGHGKGAGWKAALCYGMACAVAFAHKLPLFAFRPSDLKRTICGNVNASKGDIESALCQKFSDLPEFLGRIPPAKREHAADAVGHALMALDRYYKLTIET